MSAQFSQGDRVALHADVTCDGEPNPDGRVWVRDADRGATYAPTAWLRHASPPPAPKVEREAVPEDARVGDVYGLAPEHGRGEHAVKVIEVRPYNEYRVESLSGEVPGGWYTHATHARMNWHLVTRGPAPVPAPEAKREWQVGDVAKNKFCPFDFEATLDKRSAIPGHWRIFLRVGGKPVGTDCWREANMVRPDEHPALAASPPEPATMTAGERAYAAYWRASSIGSWNVAAFSELSKMSRDEWEAAAQAVLAAQPATVAKAEREVVGYCVRHKRTGMFAGGDPGKPGVNRWQGKRRDVTLFKARVEAEKYILESPRSWGERKEFVIVRIARTRRVPR